MTNTLKMKFLLKNIIISIASSPLPSAIAEKLIAPGISIFMFHRFRDAKNNVTGHSITELEKCLQYLIKRNYHFVSLEQIIESIINHTALPPRSIAFTMDDGFHDQAEIAAPIFIKYHCPVTIFIITGFLDKKLWPWDDQITFLIKHSKLKSITLELSATTKIFPTQNDTERKTAIYNIQNWIKTLGADDLDIFLQKISAAAQVSIPAEAPKSYQPMTWKMARQLEKQGVSFAPHTMSHRILSRLNDSSSQHEITESWQRLQQELSSPSPVFCYPTGRRADFTEREITYIKQAGLIGAVSTEATYIDPKKPSKNQLFELPRFGFPSSFDDFVQYSSWIERAKTQLLKR